MRPHQHPLENALQKGILAALPVQVPLWCGFSGGRDSTVLLHALAQVRTRMAVGLATRSRVLELGAIHVNHGLSAQADAWAAHAQAVCEGLGVPLTVVRVKLRLRAGDSVEEEARKARYAAFKAHVPRGAWLALAHHQDDQAETVLIQLLRGAGPAGLAAMAAFQEAHGLGIWRPFLGTASSLVADYASAQKLQWVEDESNASTRFKRNWLRHDIAPALREQQPALSAALARSAALCAEAQALQEALAAIDLGVVQCPGNAHEMDVSKLLSLGDARARNALRAWFAALGLRAPSAARLAALMGQLRDSQSPTHQYGKLRWLHAGMEFRQGKRDRVRTLGAFAAQHQNSTFKA
jgi:tRNA(Ile)-lysidine synthase